MKIKALYFFCFFYVCVSSFYIYHQRNLLKDETERVYKLADAFELVLELIKNNNEKFNIETISRYNTNVIDITEGFIHPKRPHGDFKVFLMPQNMTPDKKIKFDKLYRGNLILKGDFEIIIYNQNNTIDYIGWDKP